MAHIQMTDRNPSDLGIMEELTDEELLAINGGGFSDWWERVDGKVDDVITGVGGVVTTVGKVAGLIKDIKGIFG